MKPSSLLSTFFFAFLISIGKTGYAENEFIIPVSEDVEITVSRFPASGNYLIVWLAPEYGFRPGHRSMAGLLADQNIEVWQSNIVESLFLPQSTGSLRQLDGKYVADIIEYAFKTTGKKIIVAGDSYAAISALLGAHQWQSRKQAQLYLVGALLFSPNTFAYIPALGLLPEYMPIVSSTNIPIMIYQAKNSGNAGQLESLLEKLRQHNSPVYTRFTPMVASLFREEAPTPEMIENAKPIPLNIRLIIPVLEQHKVPAHAVPLNKTVKDKSGIDRYLNDFKGNNSPATINLKDINGNTFIKENYHRQVTLVNFWATWCPPCVREIPSLNRLKKEMAGHSFELISINYAEDKKTVVDFMNKVEVEFPILLDRNGDYAKKWNVISYPSTFVIDTEGKIKYGVNAAIEWDSPEVIKKLKLLLLTRPVK